VTSSETESKALVTGVSGFAGRHLAAGLIAEGWKVAGIANTSVSGVEGVDEHKIDIGDQAALEHLLSELKPGAVFHLAAIVDTVVTPSVLELQRVNVLGVVAVTEAVRAAAPDARVIYPSSSIVYGSIEPQDNPVGESQPLRPQTPYGAGKVAAESIVTQFTGAAGDAVIARAFQHTGPGHSGAYALSDWAEQLAKIELSGQPGSIATGNLDVERDYLDVRDVVAAYVALAKNGKRGEIYNVCSGAAVSMRSLLEGLIEAFGVEAEIATDQSRLRAVDQPRVVGDPSKLIADTGWSPKYEIRQTLVDLAQHWRKRTAQ
jgi:GDP-4-dehydro-6-deoxy-D-mannose reductase